MNAESGSAGNLEVRRPDRVQPYRLAFWSEVVNEDGTSEVMNVFGMILGMVAILLKYKSCAWIGLLVAGVGYANVRANHDTKSMLSTFMLSISALVMCYLNNQAPISAYLLAAPSLSPQNQAPPVDHHRQ